MTNSIKSVSPLFLVSVDPELFGELLTRSIDNGWHVELTPFRETNGILELSLTVGNEQERAVVTGTISSINTVILILLEQVRTGPLPKCDPRPVALILHCPECHVRHVDTGVFATKVHHTHECQSCGFTWRPAVPPTVGVQFLPFQRAVALNRLDCRTCDAFVDLADALDIGWVQDDHGSWTCEDCKSKADIEPADAYDSADYYDCLKDAEQLDFTRPEEAILAHITEPKPVTVYAWRRNAVPADYVTRETEALASAIGEGWIERWELGNPDEPPDDIPTGVADKLEAACKLMAETQRVWSCSIVASREYTLSQVEAILRG